MKPVELLKPKLFLTVRVYLQKSIVLESDHHWKSYDMGFSGCHHTIVDLNLALVSSHVLIAYLNLRILGCHHLIAIHAIIQRYVAGRRYVPSNFALK